MSFLFNHITRNQFRLGSRVPLFVVCCVLRTSEMKSYILDISEFFNSKYPNIPFDRLKTLSAGDAIIIDASWYVFRSDAKNKRNLLCKILKRNTGNIKALIVNNKHYKPMKTYKMDEIYTLLKKDGISISNIEAQFKSVNSTYLSRLCSIMSKKNNYKNRFRLQHYIIQNMEKIKQKAAVEINILSSNIPMQESDNLSVAATDISSTYQHNENLSMGDRERVQKNVMIDSSIENNFVFNNNEAVDIGVLEEEMIKPDKRNNILQEINPLFTSTPNKTKREGFAFEFSPISNCDQYSFPVTDTPNCQQYNNASVSIKRES